MKDEILRKQQPGFRRRRLAASLSISFLSAREIRTPDNGVLVICRAAAKEARPAKKEGQGRRELVGEGLRASGSPRGVASLP